MLTADLVLVQAKASALDAAKAARECAGLALEAVEASVQHFVAVRDYMRLKDMAEASAVAGQVSSAGPSATLTAS